MSTYFTENRRNVFLSIESPSEPGLRKSQFGACHAIVSHFTVFDDLPAIVVMPTGTGKTAIITLSPFLLNAAKVLVLSSSKLVRGQIANEFRLLKSVTALNAYKGEAHPKVYEKSKTFSEAELEKIEAANVVIGIPKAIEDLLEFDLNCPDDYFDLIIADEAHHIPATTWTKVINKFPKAKKVFFTATPFRRDRKNIIGKIIYNYPLSRAKIDGSFANIEFHAAVAGSEAQTDLSIAKKAEEIFKADRDAGLKHYLMVRADSKMKAAELIDLYRKQTKLNLELVNSSQTYTTINGVIKKLREGQLDGIVCVDMLGEGFDFPNLKIAAIHSPHKSEAITLQFIGRFTRTNANDIGDAKFIASPHDIKLGKHSLYIDGAVWNDIVTDLSESKVAEEQYDEEVMSTFDDIESGEDSAEIDASNLTPYSHVKIFKIEEVDLKRNLNLGRQIVDHKFYSEENSLLALLTRQDTKPKWINSDKVLNRNYELYVIHYNKEHKLLFINASVKSEDTYDRIFKDITGKTDPSWKYKVSKSRIHKVLLDLQTPSFFSVGMQNLMPNMGESYKTLTGSEAQNTIQRTDGMRYSNGHAFCGGEENGNKVTIGFSSASKVWSNSYKRLSEFLSWCSVLGGKITSSRIVKTDSAYDYLPVGEEVSVLPKEIASAHWGPVTYEYFPTLSVNGSEIQLTEMDFVVGAVSADKKSVVFSLENRLIELTLKMKFSIDDGFSFVDPANNELRISTGDYLLNHMSDNEVIFRTNDLHIIQGRDLYKAIREDVVLIENDQLLVEDWKAKNVDICIEFGKANSIHDHIQKMVLANGHDVVAYDHGPAETADFVCFTETAHAVDVYLYHIKASGKPSPGDRVDDLYEVCGQVVKSAQYAITKSSLQKKLTTRLSKKTEKFKKGNFDSIEKMLKANKTLTTHIFIVQPGVSKADVDAKMGSLLGACDIYLRSLGAFGKLQVLCSI